MSGQPYADAPLGRFKIERLIPDPTGEYRSVTRPFLGIGDWISMPYLTSANEQVHERYQKDRLFTLARLEAGGQVTIDVSGVQREVSPGQPAIIHRADGDIRVTLIGFSSKSVLRTLEELR